MAKKTSKATEPQKRTKRSKRRTDTKPEPQKKYRSFRLEQSIKVDSSHIPSVFTLTSRASKLFWQNKQLLSLITIVYGVLYFLFLRAVSGFSVVDTQEFLDTIYLSQEPLYTNLTVSALVLSTSFGVEVGFTGAIGLVATIVASLALIYAMRHIMADKKIGLREAYYFGAAQIVPFSMIVALIVLQLLPFALGALLFSVVTQAQIVVGVSEHMIFIAVWLVLSLLTAYWLSNSFMTLYAVSLPKMYPYKALRATGELVHHRRFVVFRKILFVLVLLLLLNMILILLAVWVWPDAAFVARDVAAVLSLLIFHLYAYTLYRTLI